MKVEIIDNGIPFQVLVPEEETPISGEDFPPQNIYCPILNYTQYDTPDIFDGKDVGTLRIFDNVTIDVPLKVVGKILIGDNSKVTLDEVQECYAVTFGNSEVKYKDQLLKADDKMIINGATYEVVPTKYLDFIVKSSYTEDDNTTVYTGSSFFYIERGKVGVELDEVVIEDDDLRILGVNYTETKEEVNRVKDISPSNLNGKLNNLSDTVLLSGACATGVIEYLKGKGIDRSSISDYDKILSFDEDYERLTKGSSERFVFNVDRRK